MNIYYWLKNYFFTNIIKSIIIIELKNANYNYVLEMKCKVKLMRIKYNF
jgi:hypothetical protein